MPAAPRLSANHGRSAVWTDKALAARIQEAQRQLGGKLREVRLDKGFSQERAAELAHLHPITIIKAESGKANVTIGTLVALAIGYDVPLWAFFGPDNGKVPAPQQRSTRRKAGSA